MVGVDATTRLHPPGAFLDPVSLLERPEVHLWWKGPRDAGDAAEERGWLSDAERRRCERFHDPRDARAFRARRLFLRAVLAGYLGRDPSELSFGENPFGKPVLRASEGLSFNLSRSGGWVLLAVTRGREVGVDLERAAEWLEREDELAAVVRLVFSAREREAFARLPPSARSAAFLRVWTRKEALVKALGTGLSREPASFEVGLDDGPSGPRALDRNGFPGEGGALLVDVAAPAGFAAALVAAGTDWQTRTMTSAGSDGEAR